MLNNLITQLFYKQDVYIDKEGCLGRCEDVVRYLSCMHICILNDIASQLKNFVFVLNRIEKCSRKPICSCYEKITIFSKK